MNVKDAYINGGVKMFLKNFFKKKEKPISVKNIFEVGEKSIYMPDYGYMLTQIATYEKRIEFSFDRVDSESLEIEKFTASVSLESEERLLPFDIDGQTIYWDRIDEAFRLRYLPEGEATPLIPKVNFYPNEVMTMEQEYAEEHYSKEALSYAVLKDGEYIWCYNDGSATPVVFETPRLFLLFAKLKDRHPLSGTFLSVHSHLAVFTPSYAEIKGITEDDLIHLYNKNLEIGKTEEKK